MRRKDYKRWPYMAYNHIMHTYKLTWNRIHTARINNLQAQIDGLNADKNKLEDQVIKLRKELTALEIVLIVINILGIISWIFE